MEGLRKFGLWLAALILPGALLVAVMVFSLMQTLGSPRYIKDSFEQKNLYESLSNFLTDELQLEGNKEQKELIGKILSSSATPENLENTFENAVDSFFAVLNKQVEPGDFSINIASLTGALEENAIKYIEDYLDSLPTCTSSAQVSGDDVLSISCVPSGMSTKKLAEQAYKELVSEAKFLSKDSLTLKDLSSFNQQDGKVQNASGPEKTLQDITNFYQTSRLVGIIAAILALLSMIGVIFLSKPFIKGVRRLGAILVPAGILLAVTAFVTKALAQNLPLASGGESLNTAAEAIAQGLITDISVMNLRFGIAEIILGALLFIVASFVISKTKPEAPQDDKPKAETQKTPVK